MIHRETPRFDDLGGENFCQRDRRRFKLQKRRLRLRLDIDRKDETANRTGREKINRKNVVGDAARLCAEEKTLPVLSSTPHAYHRLDHQGTSERISCHSQQQEQQQEQHEQAELHLLSSATMSSQDGREAVTRAEFNETRSEFNMKVDKITEQNSKLLGQNAEILALLKKVEDVEISRVTPGYS